MTQSTTPPAAAEDFAKPKLPSGKTGSLVALMRREDGATLADLIAATGWQAHSVRGAITGTIKKRLGLAVTTETTAIGLIYRIAAEPHP